MKRLFIIFLLVVIVTPIISIAEESFTLRNGYTWGMPKQEAEALAEAEGLDLLHESGSPGVTNSLNYANVPLGEYTAESLTLAFLASEELGYPLYVCTYWFEDLEQGSQEAQTLQDGLYTRLVSIYGEPLKSGDDTETVAAWSLHDTIIELNASKWPKMFTGTTDTVSYYLQYTSPKYHQMVLDALVTPTPAPMPTRYPIKNDGF